jgi:UTP--glucose-1-phosphate uridylyltransferase
MLCCDVLPFLYQIENFSIDSALLGKLAVCKVNGGLGTSMGCVGPKSAIPVRGGQTFLDLTVAQVARLNAVHGTRVPLVLMNSFNTDADTAKIVKKYAGDGAGGACEVLTFRQSRFPRLEAGALAPAPLGAGRDPADDTWWYPPGHGDIFASLLGSGTLDTLLERGVEWMFVSNADNLGATVDLRVLAFLASSGRDWASEVTNKTLADVKGGTVVTGIGAGLTLLETAQVPEGCMGDFTSIDKFAVFNTNNIWVRLPALKAALEAQGGSLALPIIRNPKTVRGADRGGGADVDVVQLETAMGAGIGQFATACGINVPRSRFLPVKTTSDLFLVCSDLYELHDSTLELAAGRAGRAAPSIDLGPALKHVASFNAAFPHGPPSIVALDSLRVVGSGPLTVGAGVSFRGDVVIDTSGGAVVIPDGTVCESGTIKA